MMTLAEAVERIQGGGRMRSSAGSVFWLEHDSQGRPVLMGIPKGYDKPVKNLVLSSEHFNTDLTWDRA